MQALSLAATHPSAIAFAVSMLGSASLSVSASTSASAMSVHKLFAFPSASNMSVPIPGLSCLLLSALLSASDVSMLVFRLLAPLYILFVSDMFVPMPGLLAPLSVSGMPVPKPGLSLLPFPIWSDL